MTLEDAMKVLSENNASSLFEAKVHSTGKVYQFRPLTVGMRKSLAKFSIGGDETKEELVKFQTAKMAMLKTLCTETLDDKTVTEVDFISLLATVRSNSSIDDLVLDMTCGNKDCKTQFKHKIDFEGIVKKCSEFKFKILEPVFYDKANRSYKLVLSYPSALDEVSMDAQSETMEPAIYKLTYPYIYVRQIFINGVEIENFAGRSLTERIALIDKLPDEILYNASVDNLYKKVYDEFDTGSFVNVYGELKCPGCGNNLEGVVTSDNFFTI